MYCPAEVSSQVLITPTHGDGGVLMTISKLAGRVTILDAHHDG